MAIPAVSRTALPPIAGETTIGVWRVPWRWIRRGLIVAVLVGSGVALRVTYFAPTVVPVSVVGAEVGRVEEIVTNNKAGTVNARRRASLNPEMGGRIDRLPVKEGDRVREGDVLLELADAELQAQLSVQENASMAAQASVIESCAAAELAARNLARTGRLAEDRLVSRQTLEQAMNAAVGAGAGCASARARVEQADAAVDMAQSGLEKTVLRAPFDGVVSKVRGQLGEWLAPAPATSPTPSVIELIDTRSIYVRAPLDEVDVARIRAGLPVRVTMDAFPGRSFPGRLTMVGAFVSEAQQQNRTLDVDVELEDAAFARTLLPGISADIEIVLQTRDGVLRVPTPAILQGGRVLVVRDGTLVGVKVRAGLANWEYTEVLDGFEPGEQIVVSLDRTEVREGARVRVEAETPP
jgi:HlyD family secretion protein